MNPDLRRWMGLVGVWRSAFGVLRREALTPEASPSPATPRSGLSSVICNLSCASLGYRLSAMREALSPNLRQKPGNMRQNRDQRRHQQQCHDDPGHRPGKIQAVSETESFLHK